MKFSIALSGILFATAFVTSCSRSNSEPISNPSNISVNKSWEATEKFKPTEDMISIDPVRGEYTAQVGQQLYYSANVHGSVGYTAEARSSAAGLDLNNSFIEYKQKQEPGMTGGDAANHYFIFDAVKSGAYEITIQKYYRGSLEKEHTIKVTVTD